MDTVHPLVSVVTPVFNSERFLADTIASVRAQTCRDFEYIIVDGGSTDRSPEIIEANRDIIAIVISEPDGGMYDAIAKGFRMARGEILGWVNSDDMWMPWCLECVTTYFRNVPECQWLTGVPAIYDTCGNLVWVAHVAPYYRRRWIARSWYTGIGLGPIQQESTFFTRDLYERSGGLDTGFRAAGDYDLWRRMARHAELHQIGTVISGFRIHEENLTVDREDYLREAGAVRIPGGKVLGAVFSLITFLWRRFRGKPRLDRMMLIRPQG